MVRMHRIALRPLLALLGVYHLLLGVAMTAAPRTFFDEVATYGAFNDHYIRDVATFYLALGVVMLVAVAKASWQTPLLVFATLQYTLHVLNHLWDIGDTDPGWLGPANAASLALIGAVLFWLLRGGRDRPPARDDGAATPPR
jgi:hypothetical protein